MAGWDQHAECRIGRAPALMLLAPLVIGILVDHLASPDLTSWLIAGGVLLIVSIVAGRWLPSALSTICILLLWTALGGARHHLSWSSAPANDIGAFANDDAQPIAITGTIASPVTIIPASDDPAVPDWMRADSSRCLLTCDAIIERDAPLPVTGNLRVYVTGQLLHAGIGDAVTIVGRLRRPGEPMNPGSFDFRDHLRQQGIRAMLIVNHPDAVQCHDRASSHSLARWRSRIRERCQQLCDRHLGDRSAPLAMSLLLGDRTQLDDDLRTAFAESGMMHLLAISGLHVGILAGLLWFGCRACGLSIRLTTLVLLGGLALYLAITDLRAPVVRASILVGLLFAGRMWQRRASSVQVIAAGGVVVLLWNPTFLFDTGAQLSFLAVAGILWWTRREAARRQDDDPLRTLLANSPSLVLTPVRTIWRRLLRPGYTITGAIWLFTLPLTMAGFHLVAPIGFALNALLVPAMAIVLACGYLFLMCGLLLPPLAGWAAMPFDGCLQSLLWCIDTAASIDAGHHTTPGPAGWWLAGYYTLLSSVLLLPAVGTLTRRAWQSVACWTMLGLAVGLLPPQRPSGLRCTFLAVGHGCAVLIECPNGRTLLYDAGSFGDPEKAERIVQAVLWERGIRRLDAVIVSHADIDHFNAIAGLIEDLPVDHVYCARPFLDYDQSGVAHLVESASLADVPMDLLRAGDALRVDDGVSITVLHPAWDWWDPDDNANSIVLEIEAAGRRLLLTGDLERSGLDELLAQQPRPVDVLMSPHHGSRAANPIALAEWATPQTVIVSGAETRVLPNLETVYGDTTPVYATAVSGAITVSIQNDGEVAVEEFFSEERE